ncbi:MAG: hypothetical protein RI572_02360 [Salegentibacter sp.]|uniref:Beta-lactamase-inhibitor-like, PepSY-like n=1 Tax=Salegentibacter flavus TaxID=287099 RepID=A0A1I4Z6R3_9FLAO|nr:MULTISPECIES: hypothetical protein [Salegentibacter]MDR9456229.1 hypothetical protein [Salegentibacter sp.]SFN45965.1 hypothetical protein SAMN05660413_01144 [Salegentibacter flavus]
MKKLIFSIVFMGIVFSSYAQKVIRLDEVTMELSSEALKLDPDSHALTVSIPEKYTGHFNESPLRFVRENFDIQKFIAANRDSDYDIYEVSFKTNKGDLKVKFNEQGELLTSHQVFKNVKMPYETTVSILKQNPNYSIVGNKHIASSRNSWVLDKEFYKIKLRNGSKSKNIKVNLDKSGMGKIAAM